MRGSINYVTQTPAGSPTWLSQVSPARVRDQPGQGPAAWTGPAPSHGPSSPAPKAPSPEKNRPLSPAQRPFPSPWRWDAPAYESARAHQALKEINKDRKILTLRHTGHSRLKTPSPPTENEYIFLEMIHDKFPKILWSARRLTIYFVTLTVCISNNLVTINPAINISTPMTPAKTTPIWPKNDT